MIGPERLAYLHGVRATTKPGVRDAVHPTLRAHLDLRDIVLDGDQWRWQPAGRPALLVGGPLDGAGSVGDTTPVPLVRVPWAPVAATWGPDNEREAVYVVRGWDTDARAWIYHYAPERSAS